jgi:hypothetical protein
MVLNAHFLYSLFSAVWSGGKNRLKLETVEALILINSHFSGLACLQFYKPNVNEKNVVGEIHYSHKYSIKDGQGLPVTDCNKSICIAVES